MTTKKIQLASRGSRFLAYLIDMLLILSLIIAFFYFVLGFDQVWQQYWNDPQNLEARWAFLKQRNWIRNSSFLIWIGYCILMEGSSYQGTFGKYLVGIKVIDEAGQALTRKVALARSLSKIASMAAFGLGFVWILFDKKNQGWHDKIHHTYVVERTSSTPDDAEQLAKDQGENGSGLA